jgi:hypothetical protein
MAPGENRRPKLQKVDTRRFSPGKDHFITRDH